jgi:FkbM family methyltransferase
MRYQIMQPFLTANMSPFFHYNSNIDAQGIMKAHAVPDLKPNDQYLTNFLGVLIDTKFFPEILEGKSGQVEPIPIPANWHADIAEWAAALRAVDLSGNSFTVIELGCGWGCWLNNTGVAARRSSRQPRLIGIEGDRGHIQFAREACATNGFTDSQVTLYHGIASAKDGMALFPAQENAGKNWGLEPIFDASILDIAKAKLTGKYKELPMVSLQKASSTCSRVDLLHIDIQGSEADLIRDCLPLLNEKVAYIVVGTHAREIEGRILASLRTAGWMLEIERPAILSLANGVPQVAVDGVQGWRNPHLSPL